MPKSNGKNGKIGKRKWTGRLGRRDLIGGLYRGLGSGYGTIYIEQRVRERVKSILETVLY